MLVNFSAATTTPTRSAAWPSPPLAAETPTKIGTQFLTRVTATEYWTRKLATVSSRRFSASAE